MSLTTVRDASYIKKIAQNLNVKVTDEACKLIATEVESALRIVIQNALKYTKHANRDSMKLNDVNHAIKDLNILDQTFGPDDNDPSSYKRELDIYALKTTKLVDLEDMLKKELQALKPEPVPSVSMNWMVVNGFIPKISENANIISLKEQEFAKNTIEMNESKESNLKNILIKEVSDNFLSRELQLFLNDVFETIKNEETAIDNATLGKTYKMSGGFKKILVTLRNSPGLNSLIPVLVNFLYQQHENVASNGILKKINLARIIMSHVFNLHYNLEFHLHILIKILLSFITSNDLTLYYAKSDVPSEIYLREISAKTLATLILRYEDKYFNVKYNIATTLIGIFEKDPSNYHTLYGILKFFWYLDPNVIKDFLLKKLAKKLKIGQLFQDMYQIGEPVEKMTGEMSSYDIRGLLAQHVYSALQELCNRVMSNLASYTSKSVYESANLYNFVSDIFGEASLIAPPNRDNFGEIVEETEQSKSARLGYLSICL